MISEFRTQPGIQLPLKLLPNGIKQTLFLKSFLEEPYGRRIGDVILKIQKSHERDVLGHLQLHLLIGKAVP
ncbi:MAG: hypothetical protein LUQ47_05655, partial [Methanotrichaceae archaeon]|nr:hypothetical protein [Methanotrichaceae archaeon]